jgi:hypothetical protein
MSDASKKRIIDLERSNDDLRAVLLLRPERRIKPGVEGGLRAASWTARRTI